jgi:hypothetical protein
MAPQGVDADGPEMPIGMFWHAGCFKEKELARSALRNDVKRLLEIEMQTQS